MYLLRPRRDSYGQAFSLYTFDNVGRYSTSPKHGYRTLFLIVKSFLVNIQFIVKTEVLGEVVFSLLFMNLCPVY